MLTTFLISLNSVLIIITIILIGWIIGKVKVFGDDFRGDISTLVVNVALPLSVFVSSQKYITKDNFKILLVGVVFIMVAIILCFLAAGGLAKVLHLEKDRKSIFINGYVNANTLFVGLPLNLALLGKQSLPYFLAYFVANTIATWGIGVKLIYKDGGISSNNGTNGWQKILNLFTPPMWGFLIGLVFFFLNLKLPIHGFLFQSFSYLANIVTPLSLIFLGLQLAQTKLSSLKIEPLDVLTQFGKFVFSPLMMCLVLVVNQRFGWIYLPSIFVKTLMIQSVTPMLTLLPMLAEQGKMDVAFSTRILTESVFIFPFAVVVVMLVF